MKKIAGILGALLFCGVGYAADGAPDMLLDQMSFQIAAKQWVSSKTALLSVDINATLTSADLIKTRADIMDKLSKVATGDWHLTQFIRSQDNSGLEKLYVQAQARVGEDALNKVYQNVKIVSKPGVSYEVASIEFKPSLTDIQQAQAQLREQLYQQVQDELTRINKVYSTQHYSLYNLIFVEGDALQPIARAGSMMNKMAVASAVAPLSVSNEINMTAIVEVASNRAKG